MNKKGWKLSGVMSEQSIASAQGAGGREGGREGAKPVLLGRK